MWRDSGVCNRDAIRVKVDPKNKAVLIMTLPRINVSESEEESSEEESSEEE